MRSRASASTPITAEKGDVRTTSDAFFAQQPSAPTTSVQDKPRPAPKTNLPRGTSIALPMPDPVNEIVILGAALVSLEARARLVKILPVDSFFAKGHPEAWAMICELERKGLAYDPLTAQQLSKGRVDTNYLDDIIKQRPELPPNLDHHVETMQWDRTRVEVIKGPLSSLVEAIRDPMTDPEVIRRANEQIAAVLKSSGTHKYLRDSSALVREQMAVIEARSNGAACFPFGIDGFDVYGPGEYLDDDERTDVSSTWRVVPGAAPKKTTVVTGVPGCGKTTVSANIGLAQVNAERRVLFAAWEQGSGPTIEMMAAHSLGISKTRLMTGRATFDEKARMRVEMDRIGSYTKFFEIPFGRKPGEKLFNDRILDTIHEYIVVSRCEVAIFDLWRRALRQFDPDEEESALYRQQAIAQETGIHQVLIHQQRFKDVEAREDKQPTREGLKGSGAWVEVPDTIIGVHRESMFKAVPSDRIRLLLLKQRFGIAPLAVDLEFDPDTGAMRNGRSANFALYSRTDGALDTTLDAAKTFLDQKGGSRGRGSSGRGQR